LAVSANRHLFTHTIFSCQRTPGAKEAI